jgi:hypothetical protein
MLSLASYAADYDAKQKSRLLHRHKFVWSEPTTSELKAESMRQATMVEKTKRHRQIYRPSSSAASTVVAAIANKLSDRIQNTSSSMVHDQYPAVTRDEMCICIDSFVDQDPNNLYHYKNRPEKTPSPRQRPKTNIEPAAAPEYSYQPLETPSEPPKTNLQPTTTMPNTSSSCAPPEEAEERFVFRDAQVKEEKEEVEREEDKKEYEYEIGQSIPIIEDVISEKLSKNSWVVHLRSASMDLGSNFPGTIVPIFEEPCRHILAPRTPTPPEYKWDDRPLSEPDHYDMDDFCAE